MTDAPLGTTEERKPRFDLRRFDQITLGTEPVFLVKGLIPLTGLTVVWGPPKCGKSFWTFDLVMHVALGWEYGGRKVQQGSAVYVALEGGKGFQARVEAFRQRYLSEDHDDVPFFLIADALNLVQEHKILIDCIKPQTTPAVVVIDTLNRSLTGSESDDKDMAAYIKAADAIRDAFQCAVIIVHHCGIDATRPRGHTSLAGAVDAQLAVKRDTGGNIVVTVERMKDGEEGATLASRLEPLHVGIDRDDDTITSCVVVPADEMAIGASRTARLSPREEIARRELANLLCDSESRPSCVPNGGKATQFETWRAACYRKGFGDDKSPDTRKKAFQRMTEKLQRLQIICRSDEWVWIPADAFNGTAGQLYKLLSRPVPVDEQQSVAGQPGHVPFCPVPSRL
jgi:hypothetical protein